MKKRQINYKHWVNLMRGYDSDSMHCTMTFDFSDNGKTNQTSGVGRNLKNFSNGQHTDLKDQNCLFIFFE